MLTIAVLEKGDTCGLYRIPYIQLSV